MTISHLLACLPTLELTTFEQQVWPNNNRFHKCTVIGARITVPCWVQTVATKEERGHKQKSSVTLIRTTAGWFT